MDLQMKIYYLTKMELCFSSVHLMWMYILFFFMLVHRQACPHTCYMWQLLYLFIYLFICGLNLDESKRCSSKPGCGCEWSRWLKDLHVRKCLILFIRKYEWSISLFLVTFPLWQIVVLDMVKDGILVKLQTISVGSMHHNSILVELGLGGNYCIILQVHFPFVGVKWYFRKMNS